MVLLYISPLPQYYALLYENICNNSYGGMCLYIYVYFVRIYKVQKKNLHINGVKISILESYAYMSRYPMP